MFTGWRRRLLDSGYAFGMVRWLGLACLLLVSAAGVAEQGCDAGVAALRMRQGELQRVKVEEMTSEVSPALRPLISGMKEALAGAVDAGVRCAPAGEHAAAMQARLVKLLDANQPGKPFTPSSGPAATASDGVYGTDLHVAVSAPANAPQMRAVVVSFGIECGDDSMLLLYEPTAAGWRLALRWQSPEYAEISGAFGGFFQFVVIPGSPWKIAVAHGTDWCTSRWSGFEIDVLTAGMKAASPRVVWHQRHGFVIESDPRMMARPDGFELRLDVGTIEGDQLVRKGVFRYRVSGDTVERVQPIAVDGRGFVDEWLQAPWSESRRWSVAEGAATLQKVHEAFANGRKDASVTYTYGPVRACSVKGQYEVEMDREPGGPEFFAIKEEPSGYLLANVGTTADERCSGRDLMPVK
ncbi:hypothetical protein [Granulicella arctica]|uniref:hypothetical protein n=1 Tax=Granulicella arctica TaxID=940613 RepID=UPI0021DF5A07|nr:hypothetical protein [Granulicella arctica]